jgi:hypothetical protein
MSLEGYMKLMVSLGLCIYTENKKDVNKERERKKIYTAYDFI